MAQQLEGLTVRIWDPPNTPSGNDKTDKTNNKTSSVGSRGYRQYTEQVGSNKLKYSTHTEDWKDKKDTKTNKKQDDTNKNNNEILAGGLRKSTRNWNARHQEQVQDLPLVSRSTGPDQGLKNIQLQEQLWSHILQKIQVLSNPQDKRSWEPIVILFRKLREGIYASHWSNNNIAFAVQVFEKSVDASIQAGDYGELVKSLAGLNDLCDINKQMESAYYTVLDILYHLCYISNTKVAMERYNNISNKQTPEAMWIKKLIKIICVTKNPMGYFKLYYNNPYPAFRFMMDTYNDQMRGKAIEILRKSYLSCSYTWISRWLGCAPQNVVAELDRLVRPSCVKTIDTEKEVVFFFKKKM